MRNRKLRLFLYGGAMLLALLAGGQVYAGKPVDFGDPAFLSARNKAAQVRAGNSIQEAIDRAKPGTTILVFPGIYYGGIVLKPGITVKSEAGAEKTVIDGQGVDRPIVVMADDSVLEGFTVAGRGDGGREDKMGIHALECINVSALVKNNIVKGNQSTGIVAKGRKAHPLIIGNIVRKNEGAGIGNEEGSSATLANNDISENFFSGIGIQKGAKPWVTGNRSHFNLRSGMGINGQGTAPLVEDNRFFSNVFSGMGVQMEASPTIKNNYLLHNNRAGIGVSKGGRPVILGNHITGNVLSGIGIIDASTVLIKGNLLADNGIAGITVMDGSRAAIVKNRVIHNTTQGIICTASYATIRNNRIIDNQHHGVGIYRGSHVLAYKNFLSHNGGEEHRGTGFMVVSSFDVLIKKNVMKNNFGPGVHCRRSAPTISNNKFSNDDILARDYAYPLITGNFFDSYGKLGRIHKGGVNCRNHGYPVIVNNTFAGKYGIAARRTSNPLIVGNIFTGFNRNSIETGRSGIKVAYTSAPVIKRNLFYNGNGIMLKRGLVKENLNQWEMNRGLWKRLAKKRQAMPVIIADNLFLEK
ncbi:MAG: right-handed parallel beta-helix repeat-containing protein [bacterium]